LLLQFDAKQVSQTIPVFCMLVGITNNCYLIDFYYGEFRFRQWYKI